MPRFIAPASNNFALATFDYADAANGYIPGPLYEDGAALLADKLKRIDPQSVSALTLAMGLLLRSSANGFLSKLMGPGAQFEGETRYPSDAILPGSAETWIWIPDEGNSYLSADLYEGKNSSKASYVFDDFQAKLKFGYPGKVFTERISDSKSAKVRALSFFPNESGTKVKLSKIELKSSGRWVVELEITPVSDEP